jgi:hypothetical protein
VLSLIRRRRPQRQPVPVPIGSLLDRPDLRIGNLLDDPRLRLAVFGDMGSGGQDDSGRDDAAA